VSWQAQNVLPTDDFELFFTPSDWGFGGGLLTGERDGEHYFLFLFSPEAEEVRDDVLPKDIVFVMDRSGSMSGTKIEQARNALHFVLDQLGENDRFSIVGFDDQLEIFSHTLESVNTDTLADARHFVDQLTAAAYTDLDAALRTGLQIMADSSERGAARIIVFLTDGLPTAGITDETTIAERAAQANAQVECRMHVFGVGYDVNTHLLDRLAADNSGSVTYVLPSENLEAVLTEFYSNIAHPVLTDVTIEFEGIEVSELHPETLPDLFQGSNLMVTGKYSAPGNTVAARVRGRAGEEEREYSYQFDLTQTGNHDFVPQLWATRKLGDLMDQVRVNGESQVLLDEIETLGLEYGLVTPYTTFAIYGHTDGAASAANMGLYDNLDRLNQVSGETTVRARAQNLAYQTAYQAGWAFGSNTYQHNGHSVAGFFVTTQTDATQTTALHVDLSLLQDQETPAGPVTIEWIEDNVGVDRTVTFGSDEYFGLAADPDTRSFLQSGANVVFAKDDEVILVQDEALGDDPDGELTFVAQDTEDLVDDTIVALDQTRPSTWLTLSLATLLIVGAILLKTWQTLRQGGFPRRKKQ
jgi:Ca-activated chloride channel family protein